MDQKTPFSQQLAHMSKGSVDAALTDDLAELVKAINDARKGGSITLTLKLKPIMASSGEVLQMQVSPEYSMKMPKPDLLGQTMFPTYDGDLLRNDPDQGQLDLKRVDSIKQTPTRLDTDG